MTDPTYLYLVRHGATKQNENLPVILQGNGIDGPLSERGEQQAREVAAALASKPLSAIYSSPMLRAQQTARAIAVHHPLPVQAVADLHEVNVGFWEGKSWPEIMNTDREEYDRFMSSPDVPYRGGESAQDVLNRVWQPMLDLFAQHAGESFAVIAHNVVNRVFLAQLMDGNLQRSRNILQMNCCVNLIRNTSSKIEVVTLNNVLHLSHW